MGGGKSLLIPSHSFIYLSALLITSTRTVCLPTQRGATIFQKISCVSSLSHLDVRLFKLIRDHFILHPDAALGSLAPELFCFFSRRLLVAMEETVLGR